jgi:glycerophosphoryl diester phosphodiesterase
VFLFYIPRIAMRQVILILGLCILCSGLPISKKPRKYTSVEALESALSYRSDRTQPLILAHRGGPGLFEAENSLETFRHTIRQVPDAILEMDVRMTLDSVLVLLHDDELDRATTGTGSIRQAAWKDVRRLFLRDLQGRRTNQHIARFDDVLKWGSGRVLMAIDAKPGVDLLKMMSAISRAGALNSVFIICYSVDDAKLIRLFYPNCWIALGFDKPGQLEAIQGRGVALRHLIALAGRQKADFYQQLHAAGIPSTVSTYGSGNLDSRPIEEAAREYRRLVETGADIITTDRAVDVDQLFK